MYIVYHFLCLYFNEESFQVKSNANKKINVSLNLKSKKQKYKSFLFFPGLNSTNPSNLEAGRLLIMDGASSILSSCDLMCTSCYLIQPPPELYLENFVTSRSCDLQTLTLKSTLILWLVIKAASNFIYIIEILSNSFKSYLKS